MAIHTRDIVHKDEQRRDRVLRSLIRLELFDPALGCRAEALDLLAAVAAKGLLGLGQWERRIRRFRPDVSVPCYRQRIDLVVEGRSQTLKAIPKQESDVFGNGWELECDGARHRADLMNASARADYLDGFAESLLE
jgi:hypothetical protein